jgi:hypothetical protein
VRSKANAINQKNHLNHFCLPLFSSSYTSLLMPLLLLFAAQVEIIFFYRRHKNEKEQW